LGNFLMSKFYFVINKNNRYNGWHVINNTGK
jgi:hypothetical protein